MKYHNHWQWIPWLLLCIILTSFQVQAKEMEHDRIHVKTGKLQKIDPFPNPAFTTSPDNKYRIEQTSKGYTVVDAVGNLVQTIETDMSFVRLVNNGIIFYRETRPRYQQFYLVNLHTKATQPLGSERLNDPPIHYRFSPDGRYATYIRQDQEWTNNLHLMDMFAGSEQIIPNIGTSHSGVIWSPDGHMLAYVDQNTDSSIRIIQPDGILVHQFPPHSFPLDWSHNGQHLLITNRETQTLEVVDTHTWQSLLAVQVYEVSEARWSPDDSHFFAIVRKQMNDLTSLWVGSVANGTKPLSRPKRSYLFNGFWSPDSQYIYITREILARETFSLWNYPLLLLALYLIISGIEYFLRKRRKKTATLS